MRKCSEEIKVLGKSFKPNSIKRLLKDVVKLLKAISEQICWRQSQYLKLHRFLICAYNNDKDLNLTEN